MAATPNLGLHQWEPGDSFLRTDFNEDFSKIDRGVGERLRLKFGVFTANGTNLNTVSVGVKPKLIFLMGNIKTATGIPTSWGLVGEDFFFYDYGSFNGLLTDGRYVRLTEDGFQITDREYFNNEAGDEGWYIVLY